MRQWPVRGLVMGQAASAFGGGVFLSFLPLYLNRSAGPAAVALVYAILPVAAVTATFLAGIAIDRGYVRPVIAVGTLAQLAGTLVTAETTGPLLPVGAALMGAGGSCLYAAFNILLAGSEGGGEQSHRFALSNLGVNAGMTAGVLLGGLIFEQASTEWAAGVRIVCVAIYGFALFSVGRTPVKLPVRHSESLNPASASRLFREVGVMLSVQFAVSGFCFVWFETVVTTWVGETLDNGGYWVSALFVVNGALVLALQVPLVQLTKRLTRPAVLKSALAVWGCAWLILAAGALASGEVLVLAVIAFAIIFAVSECLFAASFMPILVDSTAPGHLGRVQSLATVTGNVSDAVAPSVGLFLISRGAPAVAWASVAVLCYLLAFFTKRTRSSSTTSMS